MTTRLRPTYYLTLYQEMQQVKAENNNLVGRLSQSDEKTSSFKSLLQTLGEQLRKLEKENKDLKIAFQVRFSFRDIIYCTVVE